MKKIDPSREVKLLRRLLTEMVAYPGDLVIQAQAFFGSAQFSIQAHAADTPRLIGTGSINYRSIRAIMIAACGRRGYAVEIPKIKEPVTGSPEQYRFVADPNWPCAALMDLLGETIRACVEQPDAVEIEAHHDNDNITSIVEVFVARTENRDVLRALTPAVKTIFDAIGRANGRMLNVVLIPEAEPRPAEPKPRSSRDKPQPATARGRFTGEVER